MAPFGRAQTPGTRIAHIILSCYKSALPPCTALCSPLAHTIKSWYSSLRSRVTPGIRIAHIILSCYNFGYGERRVLV